MINKKAMSVPSFIFFLFFILVLVTMIYGIVDYYNLVGDREDRCIKEGFDGYNEAKVYRENDYFNCYRAVINNTTNMIEIEISGWFEDV